jgi:thymidylate kinase
MTKTILFEGVDFSGKTTLTEAVREQAIAAGKQATINQGPLQKHSPWVHIPLAIAKMVPASLKECCYTASLLADSFPQADSPDFFIQERYFPSVIAYSKVLSPFGINRMLGERLRRMYYSFDVNILIKASPATRLERIKARANKTPLDKLIEQTPQLGVDIEQELRIVLSRERNYFEIDTDALSVDEAAKEIYWRIT